MTEFNLCKKSIQKNSYALALRIVKLYKFLTEQKREFIPAKQILRSGTSVGANITEAQGGISKADFSAKLSIAYKEALETKYWLNLLVDSDYLERQQFD